MDEGWRIVFDSANGRIANDRALVLHSLDIPYQLQNEGSRVELLVPAAYFERAQFELWQYDRENRPADQRKRSILPPAQDGVPGVLAYATIICLVAGFAGRNSFGLDWLSAGRIDGELIRSGEWWRSITALTLHSGLRHLLGNLAFGVFFGLLAGRLLGSGLTWLAVVLASAVANLLNTLMLDSVHRSIGASTAVFATLGLVAGFVWRGKFMHQDRWAYRLGPIVGGLALLAYTGTGDANTDIGAHLLGFACGFATGMLVSMTPVPLSSATMQRTTGAVAFLVVVGAWLVAF